MAKRRMIHKEDVESPIFGELSFRQRYLYWAIELYADDDGVIPIKLVKGVCFPFDDEVTEADVVEDLYKLQEIDLIILYCEDRYLQVTYWWTKQFIAKNIYTPTTFPTPPKYMERPEDLAKYHPPKEMLEQKRVAKMRLSKEKRGKTSSYQKSPAERVHERPSFLE